MWFLAAAVAVFAALSTLNLILTLGVVRRLREQSELIAATGTESVRPMLDIGQLPAEFATTTVDGETLTRDALTGATLVAFLSPYCDACEEQVPGFLERATAMPGGRDNVLAVVVGRGEEPQAYAQRFRSVARVVVEPASGPVSSAFEPGGFPAFGLLGPDGRIAANAVRVDRLDLPVAR
jgi:hypothetical protein